MAYKLLLYNYNEYHEFRLPLLENADHLLRIPASKSGLNGSFRLRLEVLEGRWRLSSSMDYCVLLRGKICEELTVLSTEETYELIFTTGERLALLFREESSGPVPFSPVFPPPDGEILAGRGPHCRICYDHLHLVSWEHVRFRRENGHWNLKNLGGNGVYVNSRMERNSCTLKFGDRIHIFGLRIAVCGACLMVDKNNLSESCRKQMPKEHVPEDAPVNREGRGRGIVYIHRTPRIGLPSGGEEIEVQGPPSPVQIRESTLMQSLGPAFTMLLPMLTGSMFTLLAASSQGRPPGLFMFSGIVMTGSSAIASLLWSFSGRRLRRKNAEIQEQERRDAYAGYLKKKEEQIASGYEACIRSRIIAYPDAEHLVNERKQRELWNRNPDQQDFLCHRIGTGELPSPVKIRTPAERFSVDADPLAEAPSALAEKYRSMRQVPVLVDLKANRMIGLVGGDKKNGAVELAQNLTVQIAACNCYTEVKLAFLCAEGELTEELLAFVRWLPHVWSENKSLRFLADSEDKGDEAAQELCTIFRQRLSEKEERKTMPMPHYVVFISASRMTEQSLLYRFLTTEQEVCGLTTVVLAGQRDELPNCCRFVIENTESENVVRGLEPGSCGRLPVSFDHVRYERADGFARRLYSCRVREARQNGELPGNVTFFSMYQVSCAEELCIRERWLKQKASDHLQALIGIGAGDQECILDVHERYHGPHGLIAGTTGSGKSEFLQTYILSLCVNYSPEEVSFFIIDYKGGGMADLLKDLPHLAGDISNLSGNQIDRALTAIRSENLRRQRLLKKWHVNHVDEYAGLYHSGKAPEMLPHLFLIVDEFAELKKDQPDFMKELISIAQVGRSLGIHLILSTQKPGGTVDDHIWSNARFRLCLRVQDRSDSMEMLRRPEAAFLKGAGQCYLQVGNNEWFVKLQSGYCGAPGRESRRLRPAAVEVSLNGGQRYCETEADNIPADNCRTQMQTILEEIRRVKTAGNYPAARRLWLPPLPLRLYLDSLTALKNGDQTRTEIVSPEVPGSENQAETLKTMTSEVLREAEVTAGLVDDPENQRQDILKLQFPECGHTAVIGKAGSGKSEALFSIIYQLVKKLSPRKLQLYFALPGSSALEVFEGFSHTGGVIDGDDPEHTKRFFWILQDILEKRLQERKEAGRSSFQSGRNLPVILLVIDDWGACRMRTGDTYDAFLLKAAREGPDVRMFLLTAAGGISSQELPARVFALFKTVLCLELNDRFGYGEALRIPRTDICPEKNIPGRGLCTLEGRVLEFQTAAVAPEKELTDKMQEIRLMYRNTGEDSCVRRVPVIPRQYTWDSYISDSRIREIWRETSSFPVGWDPDTGEAVTVRLREENVFLVTGGRGTGRHNFLRVLGALGEIKNMEVLVMAPDEEKPLLPEAYRCCPGEKDLISDGGEDILARFMSGTGDKVGRLLLISDLEWWSRTLGGAGKALKVSLENRLKMGKGCGFMAAGILREESKSFFRTDPLLQLMGIKARGVHFGGNMASGSIMDFSYLSYQEQSRKQPAGTGYLSGSAEGLPGCRVRTPFAAPENGKVISQKQADQTLLKRR